MVANSRYLQNGLKKTGDDGDEIENRTSQLAVGAKLLAYVHQRQGHQSVVPSHSLHGITSNGSAG
jgi:hypothetical protein